MAISSSIVFNKQLFVNLCIFLLFLLALASSSFLHFYVCCFLCGIIKFHWFERAFIFDCLCGCWLSSFILVLLLPCFLQATLSIHKNDLFLFFMLWKFYWFARICCVHVSLCQCCCNIAFYNFFFLSSFCKTISSSFFLNFFSSVVAITSFDFLMVLKHFCVYFVQLFLFFLHLVLVLMVVQFSL